MKIKKVYKNGKQLKEIGENQQNWMEAFQRGPKWPKCMKMDELKMYG